MSFAGVNFDVNIDLSIDAATREVRARFESIIPSSGLPPSVDVGFLPPEKGTDRGKGHISYTIRPDLGLSTGTEIRNIGFVSFDPQAGGATFRTDLSVLTDPNSPADLNRQALVTIDAEGPASSVVALPSSSSAPALTVRWSGNDVGAGIVGYDIYSKINDGAWTLWLNNVAETTAVWPEHLATITDFTRQPAMAPATASLRQLLKHRRRRKRASFQALSRFPGHCSEPSMETKS